MASDETALTVPSGLDTALAVATEAGDIPALRDIAAYAAALQKGAKERGMGIEAENQAAEVVIRAERGIGRALIEMAEDGTRQTRGLTIAENRAKRWGAQEDSGDNFLPPTLSDLGIDKNDSRKFQLLARIPDSEFNARFERVKAAGSRLAKVDFYRLVKPTIARAKAAQKAIREEEHADDATPAFAAFEKAVEGLTFIVLPDDELALVAGLILRLRDAYNAEHNRRRGGE